MKKIGSGKFSNVFLCDDKKNVKKVYNNNNKTDARREHLYLSLIDWKGVVKSKEYNAEENAIFVEYVPTPLQKNMAPQKIENCIAEIALSLIHIFNAGIVMNDVKPENIGMQENYPILFDFGLATTNLYKDEHFRGTISYASPEKIKYRSNTQQSDIFALGMTWYYLINKRTIASDFSLDDYKQTILNNTKWEKIISSIPHKLLQSMLSFDPQKRPTPEEIYRTLKNKNPAVQLNESFYIFQQQLELAEKLWKEKQIAVSPLDEPQIIANAFQLFCESKNKDIKIIDELQFYQTSKSIMQVLNIKNEKELLKGNHQFKETLCILRRRYERKSEIISKLSEDNYTILIDSEKQPQSLSNNEILAFSTQFKLSKLIQPNQQVNAKIMKSFVQKEKSILSDEIHFLFQLNDNDLPMDLFDTVLADYLPEIMGQIRVGNMMISNQAFHLNRNKIVSKTPSNFKNIVSKIHESKFYFQRAILYLNENAIQNSAEMLDKHILKLIKSERFIAALDFLQWMEEKSTLLQDNFLLQKRKAFLLRKANRIDESISLYKCLIAKTDGVLKGILLSDYAVVLNEMEQFEKALESLNEASKRLRNQDDKRAYLRVTNNLAVSAYNLNEFHKAIRAFKDILSYAESNHISRWILISKINISEVNFILGNWKKSLLFAQEAMDLSVNQNQEMLHLQSKLLHVRALALLQKIANPDEILHQFIVQYKASEKENEKEIMFPVIEQLYFIFQNTALKKHFLEIENEGQSIEILCSRFWQAYIRNDFLQCVQLAKKAEDDFLQNIIAHNFSAIIEKISDLIQDDRIYEAVLNMIRIKQGMILSLEEKEILKKHAKILEINLDFSDVKQENGVVWEMLHHMLSTTSSDEVLRVTLQSLVQIGNMERAVFYEDTGNGLAAYLDADGSINPSYHISKTILNDVKNKNEICYFSDLMADDFQDVEGSIFGLGLRSAVCFPLKIQNEFIGIFYSDTKSENQFTHDEKYALEVVFTQAKSLLEKNFYKENFEKKSNTKTEKYYGMIASSPKMKNIFEQIKIIGKHDVSVLITGETGTGKELIAKAIHKEYRLEAPFIAVNCAAIPEHLLESELFGYKKGAFTGAEKDKVGFFEAARNGILFLDEIGELPLHLQPKVLRVLQEKEVVPVGGVHPVKVQMRVIAATHRDLNEMVKQQTFRQDLLYRIGVMPIRLPALRDRIEDLPLLVMHFITKFNEKFDKEIKAPSNNYLRNLAKRNWDGNIRELENEIEKAVLLSQSEYLTCDEEDSKISEILDEEIIPLDWKTYKRFRKQQLEVYDKKYVDKLLKTANGNVSVAAKLAGFDRAQFYRLKK